MNLHYGYKRGKSPEELSLEEKLKKVTDIDGIIKAIGEIRGDLRDEMDRLFYPHELIKIIERARHGHLDLENRFNPNPIPDIGGLAPLVKRLLSADATYLKSIKRQESAKER